MEADKKIRILIVDDQPQALQGVARILKTAGYETLEASTGEQCLKLAQESRPDLILLDVVLPDIDGREVCERIKADSRTSDSYVVLLSSIRIESESQSAGLEHGADGYIARPIPNRELLARVKALLRLKETERRLSDALEFGETMLATSPVGIAAFGPDGGTVAVNEAMATVLGGTREKILNLNFRDLESWKTTGLAADAEEVVATGVEKRREVQTVTTFGRDVWLDCRFSRFKSKDEFHLLLTVNDITATKQAEKEKERLIGELQEALAKIKTLSGMLPICGECKRIRDDKGDWQRLEYYIRDHSEAEFTHSVCPECARKLYPELYEDEG